MGIQTSIAAASGVLSASRPIIKFGFNPSIDTATPADIYVGGATGLSPDYLFPENHEKLEIFSDDPTDQSDITIEGLNRNWKYKTSVVELDGTTPMDLPGRWMRIHRAYNSDSVKYNGTVRIRVKGTTDDVAVMSPKYQQTELGIYTTSDETSGYITRYHASMIRGTNSGAARVGLYIREFGGVFRLRHLITVSMTGDSSTVYEFDSAISVSPMTDIKIRAEVTEDGTGIAAGFTLAPVENQGL